MLNNFINSLGTQHLAVQRLRSRGSMSGFQNSYNRHTNILISIKPPQRLSVE